MHISVLVFLGDRFSNAIVLSSSSSSSSADVGGIFSITISLHT
jgi:hypothetical protein